MRTLLLALGLGSLVSCATSLTENRRELSAGRVGCQPDQIQITDERSWSWVSVCNGKRWICSGGSSIDCKPLE